MFLRELGEKWLEVDGVRTRYFDEGQGQPVVFIHGGTIGDASGGESARDFDLNFTPLSRDFRCIALDRLGQGLTGLPARDADYTMAASVRHTTGFLRALAAGPCHLVGHSRGAYVAARITLENPGLVASCILVDTATGAPGQGRNDILFAANPHAPGTIDSARFVYEKYSHAPAAVTPEWLAMKQELSDLPKNREAARKMRDEGLLAARFLPDLVDDRDDLFARIAKDGLRRPVLLVWGYNDPTAPLDLGFNLFNLVASKQKRTSLHVLNKAGHFSFRERAEAFNRVVADFVEGVDHGD